MSATSSTATSRCSRSTATRSPTPSGTSSSPACPPRSARACSRRKFLARRTLRLRRGRREVERALRAQCPPPRPLRILRVLCAKTLPSEPAGAPVMLGSAGRWAMVGRRLVVVTVLMLGALPARAADVVFPVLVPLTGGLSIEGTSQRNGALLAVKNAPAGVTVNAPVSDTAQSPEGAVNAFEKAMASGPVIALGASMFGPHILAMLPLGPERKVPLIT